MLSSTIISMNNFKMINYSIKNMANGLELGDEMDEKKIWMVVLFAVLGGNASGFANYLTPDVRADKFSGSDAAILKAELIDRT